MMLTSILISFPPLS